MTPTLVAMSVDGSDAAWAAAGFTVTEGRIAMGAVEVRLAPGPPTWTLTEVDDGALDGLPTFAAPPDRPPPPPSIDPPAAHANTTTAIDHVVVASPDLDRTTEALGAAGIELRRTRDAGRMEQRFFRVGEVVLELVGAPGAHGDGPASFWGLALTVEDLDAAAGALGDHLGPVTHAVQPGRRIATLRHEPLGLPLPIAFLTPRPPRRP